jgi:hypothetical protein
MKKETDIEKRIDALIAEERDTAMNPYLSTRVMAAIERQHERKTGMWPLLWKPVLALASLVFVVWLGITAGNGYPSGNTEEAFVLSNDAATEQFAFYLQTEKEE